MDVVEMEVYSFTFPYKLWQRKEVNPLFDGYYARYITLTIRK